MNPHLKYRNAKAIAWTRIDMLLVIYEAAIEALDRGVNILESQELSDLPHARIDAQRRVLLIAEGLSIDEDPTAAHIMNLCVFVLDQIQTDSLENWKTSVKLIETLHEGFQEIADDARELERTGQIPQLET
jgi:flagellin-specific chaperone FliS